MSISASEARRRLFPLIEEVNDNAEAVEIVSKAGSAYLVPATEYEAWKTTMHLFAAPANARHLIESYREATAGRAEPHDLVDPDEVESPNPDALPLLARMDESEVAKLASSLASHGFRVRRSGSFRKADLSRGDALFHLVPVPPEDVPEMPDAVADLHLVVGEHGSGARDS